MQRQPLTITEETLVSAAELARRWNVSEAHVKNLQRQGMPSLLIGRCRRFRPSECERWLDAPDVA